MAIGAITPSVIQPWVVSLGLNQIFKLKQHLNRRDRLFTPHSADGWGDGWGDRVLLWSGQFYDKA
jgi:hypothetical protein